MFRVAIVILALSLRDGPLLSVPVSLGLLVDGGFACGGACALSLAFPIDRGSLGVWCCVRGGTTWGVPLSRVCPVLFGCGFSELRSRERAEGMGAGLGIS